MNIGHDFIDLTMICQFETIDLMNQLKSIEMLFIEISNYEFRDEDFTDLISPYLKVAELRINETTSTLMKIDDLFAETVAYLGEDLNEYHGLFEEENARKRLHPMDLFRMLDVFFVSFREAVESTRPKEVVERRRGSGAQSDTDDEN